MEICDNKKAQPDKEDGDNKMRHIPDEEDADEHLFLCVVEPVVDRPGD